MKELKINTFLLGVQKAGTSSLHNWLAQHPDIYAPVETKDYHFFNKYNETGDHQKYLQYYKQYNDQKILLRGAVNYIYLPYVAERICGYNPDAKLIIVLRDPCKRAVSAYNFFYKIGQEKESWNNAVKRETEGKNLSMIAKSNFNYLEHGLYSKQIEQYLKYFSLENIKVLIYEELVNDKQRSISDLFKFLGVSYDFVPKFNHVNKTGSPKFLFMNRLLNGDNVIRKIIRPFVRLLTSEKVRILFGNWLRETNTSNKISVDMKESFDFPRIWIDKYKREQTILSKLLNKDIEKIWNIK